METEAFVRYAHTVAVDWLHVPDHAVMDFIHLTNHFWHHNVMTEVAVPQVGSLSLPHRASAACAASLSRL